MIFKKRIKSFVKYSVVGGIAFGADAGTIIIIQKMFAEDSKSSLYISVAMGFLVGLSVNFFLSSRYVFENQNINNWEEKSIKFGATFLIGILGLLLTEVGMHMGTQWLGIHYIVVKIIVAGFVLIWNYTARLLLVFK